jgi:hypothetical protein
MTIARHIVLCSLVVASSLVGISCRKADEKVAEAPEKGTQPTETTAPTPKVEIPPAEMTESLKYLGAPFEKPIKYKMTGAPAISEATQTFSVQSADEGKVVLVATWDNAILGSEVYESRPDGVWHVELRGERLKEPVLFLPPDPAPGKQWTQDFTLTMSGESLRFVNRMRIVGREKLTVPLGEFDAIVIEQSSTITSANARLTGTGKTWLAQGIGIVKSVLTNKGTRGTEKVNSTIEVIAIK